MTATTTGHADDHDLPPGVPTAPRAGRTGGRDLDEPTLVVRAQEGDLRAFEVLARRHQAALYRLAVRVLDNRDDAEDALQDALLDAWRRIGRFRGEASFSTWMYRIVTNRCLGLLRRRGPALPVAEMAEMVEVAEAGTGIVPMPARRPSPEDAAELDAGLVALRAALADLPTQQRVCFILRELEGLGYAEIAQITGAGEQAVRGRIHRARTRLAEVMRPWR